MDAFKAEELDTEYLKNPSPLIKLFSPTVEKLQDFGTKLMTNYLYVPDEYRTEEGILSLMAYYFPYGQTQAFKPFNVWFELGEWGGLLGFTSIRPGHKCGALLKIWDKAIWGPTLYRGLKELSSRFMNEYKLQRCGLMTADERMMKLAKKLGFRCEGTQAVEFSWDGKLYTQYLLRKIIRDGKEN